MPQPDVETVSWIRFAFASVTVLTLLALLGWFLKYATLKGWFTPQAGRSGRRLTLKGSLSLDARRRVVLVQKDDREYTLLIGGNSDLLLESGPAPQYPDDDTPTGSKQC